jgi:hypothetical protein
MNAAYIRLKNIQLGYNLPQRLLEGIGVVKAARVYLSGENLWTWSPLYRIMDNIDVENATAPADRFLTSSGGDGFNYPMLKTTTLGVSITF